MLNKINKSNEGFTIIEVMIVLAIAGLILLIVFLAVPALQRNSRNTARKTDVGRIASAINNYVSNNAGSLPPSATWTTATTGGEAVIANDAGSLSQYTGLSAATSTSATPAAAAAGTYDFLLDTSGTTVAGPNTNQNMLILATGQICSGNTTTATGATPRNAALLYDIEPGGTGNWTWVCLDIQ